MESQKNPAATFFDSIGLFFKNIYIGVKGFFKKLFTPKKSAPESAESNNVAALERETGVTPAAAEPVNETPAQIVSASSEVIPEKKPSPLAKAAAGIGAAFGSLYTKTKSGMARRREAARQRRAQGPVPIFCERIKPPNYILSVLVRIIQICFVLAAAVIVIGVGMVLGVAKAYVETTPDLNLEQIENQNESSYIYDSNGNLITIYTGTENRDWAKIEEIPRQLRLAFIAIEDVRFESHPGIDIKRLFGALINNFFNETTTGGSTITQQLIKMRLLTPERSYKRKLQEAYLAMQLEQQYSKDEILEAYLNSVPLGDSNYGVKAAARDYFGKELNELSLLECATLAGLTQNPYTYNPRKNFYVRKTPEKTLNRTKQVLNSMYKAGFITYEERAAALADTLHVVETATTQEMYDMPYFVEYAVSDVVTQMLAVRGLPNTKENRVAMENEIRTNGYRIYTTVDPEIQNATQESLSKWEKYPAIRDKSKEIDITPNADGTVTETIQPQAAAVVIDYRTGEIKALVGGRDTPTRKKVLNRAVSSTMPVGSSIKPLAVYGPALDKGLSPGTIINNIPVMIPGWGTKTGYPSGGMSKPGPVSIRKGVVESLNVVAARVLMDYVTVQDSVTYLEALGIDPSHINADGPGLALGTSGITPLEMTAAFAAIANGGEYISPTSFTVVQDRDGNVLLNATALQERRQVFKKSTAWLLTSMLQDAVGTNSGTGTRARIPGMNVAGKTGTNDDARGVYFAGYTPYYASALWIGHDKYYPLASGAYGGTFAAPLWQDYMAKIHEGLENRPIIDATPESLGLVRATVCGVSGKVATAACAEEYSGFKPVTEYFVRGTQPAETCDMHYLLQYCTESQKLATTFCPETASKSATVFPVTLPWRQEDINYLKTKLPNIVDIDPEALEALEPGTAEYAQYYCDIHTEDWFEQAQEYEEAAAQARALIKTVREEMAEHADELTQAESGTLSYYIKLLEDALNTTPRLPAQTIREAAGALENNYLVIFARFE